MPENGHPETRQRYARIAGAAYLAIIVSSMLSLALVDLRIAVEGDLAATIGNIPAHEALYRVDMAYELVMYAAVALLAVTLFMLLRGVNFYLALLAAAWRIIEAAVGSALVLLDLVVIQTVTGADFSAQDGTAMLLVGSLLEAHDTGYQVVILSLSLGTVVFCALFWQSRLIPRWLSGFGIVAFGAMVPVSLFGIAAPDLASMVFMPVGAATILFELVIGGWLLVRGVRAS